MSAGSVAIIVLGTIEEKFRYEYVALPKYSHSVLSKNNSTFPKLTTCFDL